MDDKIKIRASALDSFADCMVRGIATTMPHLLTANGYSTRTRRRSVSAVVGTAAHAGVAMDLGAIAAGDERPKQSDVEDLVVSKLDDGASDPDVPTTWDDLTPNRQEAIRQLLAITRVHYQRIAPLATPVMVEARLWAQLGDRVVLTGQPDSIDDNGVVNDLKTGRDVPHLLQLGAYGLLAESNGMCINAAEIVGIPRPRNGRPIEVYTDRIDGDHLHHGAIPAVLDLVDNITKTVDTVISGNPIYQVNPASTMCSRRFCPAYGTNFCIATHGK